MLFLVCALSKPTCGVLLGDWSASWSRDTIVLHWRSYRFSRDALGRFLGIPKASVDEDLYALSDAFGDTPRIASVKHHSVHVTAKHFSLLESVFLTATRTPSVSCREGHPGFGYPICDVLFCSSSLRHVAVAVAFCLPFVALCRVYNICIHSLNWILTIVITFMRETRHIFMSRYGLIRGRIFMNEKFC